MIHPGHRVASTSMLLAFAGAATLAFAGLKSAPPDGVKLAGTEWQLDRYNSDDPAQAIERANREAARPTARGRPVFGGDDPLGRHAPGSDPIGGRRTSGPLDRDSGPGGWHQDRSNDSADIDPTGGTQSMTMQWGTTGSRSIFFEALRTNPDKLSFAEGKQYVTVTAGGLETECVAGVKAPFSDSYGDGKRSCGWSGRAWVVETTRGHFSRTDRYELSKDGKKLKYITTASEDGAGRVTITRRYQIPQVTR